MLENLNLFLSLININNMHRTRHILPISRTCIWVRCGRCGVSWHRRAPAYDVILPDFGSVISLISNDFTFPNTFLKYADGTNLLVPQNSPVFLEEEFAYIIDWSFNNKLTVNTSKTKEPVFRHSRFTNKLPPFLHDIQRIDSIKLFGVYLSHTLSPDQHINHLLSQCNQRLYLVSQLKSQNISAQCLDIIFQALILAKITYAVPSFAGLISVTFRSKINKFFHKAHSVDLPLHSLTFRV